MFFKTLFCGGRSEFKFSNVALQSLEIKLILYCCSDKGRKMHYLKRRDLIFSKIFLLFQREDFK